MFSSHFFSPSQECTDERLRCINEVLLGIKLIKLSAWEGVFREKISHARRRELRHLDLDSCYWTIMSEWNFGSSLFVVVLLFLGRLSTFGKLTYFRWFFLLKENIFSNQHFMDKFANKVGMLILLQSVTWSVLEVLESVRAETKLALIILITATRSARCMIQKNNSARDAGKYWIFHEWQHCFDLWRAISRSVTNCEFTRWRVVFGEGRWVFDADEWGEDFSLRLWTSEAICAFSAILAPVNSWVAANGANSLEFLVTKGILSSSESF